MVDHAHMNRESANSPRRGRPKLRRLTQSGVALLKRRIHEEYKSAAYFYTRAFEEAGQVAYQGLKQPRDLESVVSAFTHAFARNRPLPEIYLRVVEELFEITRQELIGAESGEATQCKNAYDPVDLENHNNVPVSPAYPGNILISSPTFYEPESPFPKITGSSVQPFTLLSTSTAFFRKPRLVSGEPHQFQHRDVFYEQLPHLSPLSPVKENLDAHLCAVIRGPTRSGRTVMAQQIAMDHIRRSGYAACWDLAVADVTEGLISSALGALSLLSKTTSLLVLDNAASNPRATLAIYKHWEELKGNSRLLLIDTWAPITQRSIVPALSDHHRAAVIDLTYNFDDFIRVYEFWKYDYASRAGKLLPHRIFRHLFGASLGRFCDGLAACATARRVKHDLLLLFDSGELVMDLKKLSKHRVRRTHVSGTASIPAIDSYLQDHPAERAGAVPMKKMLAALDEGRGLSNTIARHYGSLENNRILKWYYLLEPFALVIRFLQKVREEYPSVFSSYAKALVSDPQFSYRMACRVIDIEHGATSDYIALADRFLPDCHKAHLIECIYNVGPFYFRDSRPSWDFESVRSHLGFTERYLPRNFSEALLDTWKSRKNCDWLHGSVARLAKRRGLSEELMKDELVLRLIGVGMLERIASSPDSFMLRKKPAISQIAMTAMPIQAPNSPDVGSRP